MSYTGSMLYTFLLALHLGTACLTGGVVTYILYALWRGIGSTYRASALVLGGVAGLEVATGTLLAVLSATVTAGYLASHIALYLGVCVAVEALLCVRMRRIAIVFPLTFAAAPVLASLVLFATAWSYGL